MTDAATRWTLLPSPVGDLLALSRGPGLAGLHFTPHERLLARLAEPVRDDELPLFKDVAEQLAQYFDGGRERFELPLAPSGSDFQRRVWGVLPEIPYGATWSYGEVAARLGL